LFNQQELTMRISRPAIVASLTALALAGTTALAMARQPDTHAMKVRLPDGTVEQISYTGAVAPRVVLVPADVAFAPAAAPFAMLDRMAAVMDREAAQLFRVMDTGPFRQAPMGGAFPLTLAGMAPAGGVCMHSIQITYRGGNARPHVVSRTSGCGPDAAPAAARSVHQVMPVPGMRRVTPMPASAGRLIEARSSRAASPAAVHEVAWNR
jgi:hypothetical protein